MAAVSITVGKKSVASTSAAFIIYSEGGTRVVVSRAPREVDVDSIGQEWTASNRPGRAPVYRHTATKTPTASYELVLGSRDITKSCQIDLDNLIKFATTTSRLVLLYSKIESGTWRITNFSYHVDHRNLNNEPTRVTCQVEFTQISPTTLKVGSTSGGTSSKPASSGSSSSSTKTASAKKTAVRTYTVKKGDTLWAISIRYYGSGLSWRKIADANGVRDPRKLPIGKVLRIP
jgi:LysM repeat protein